MSEAVAWILDGALVASVRVALIVACAFVAARLIRGAGSDAHVGLWRGALVLSITATVVPPTGWGALPVSVTVPTLAPESRSAVTHALVPAESPLTVASAPPARTTGEERFSWALWVAAAWLCGGVVLGTRYLVASAFLARRVRAGVAAPRRWEIDLSRAQTALAYGAPVTLRCVEWPGAPALYGFKRPVILMPNAARTWPPARRHAVLVHELVHAHHKDAWFTRAALVLRVALWFHPAVYWLERRLSRAQELRCDRVVVRSGIDAADYADSLVTVARDAAESSGRSHPRAAPRLTMIPLGFAQRASLEERVKAVLAPTRVTKYASVFVTLALALAATTAASVSTPGSTRLERNQEPRTGDCVVVQLGEGLECVELTLNASVRVRRAEHEPALRLYSSNPARTRRFVEGLDFGREGGTVRVTSESRSLPAITCELLLPAGTSAAVLVSRGSIDVDLPVLNDHLHARCSLGDVSFTLRQAGSRGEASLTSSRGSVTLRAPDVCDMRIDATCSLGPVERPTPRAEASGMRFHAHSALGAVRVLERTP